MADVSTGSGAFRKHDPNKGGPVQAECRFDSRLFDALVSIRGEFADAVQFWGEDAARIARRLAPEDTGHLKLHIENVEDTLAQRIDRGNGKMKDLIRKRIRTVDTPWAAKNEFGTRRQPSRPFMVPAVVLARDNTRERIKREKLTKRRAVRAEKKAAVASSVASAMGMTDAEISAA